MRNQSEFYESYEKGDNIGRVFNTIKNSIVKTAKCESGRLKVGEKMPERKKKGKKKRTPTDETRLPAVPTYDMLGSTVNMINNQMMMMTDGLDLALTNVIADNSNMAMGMQGDSYFTLRHQMSFEGPLGFLMSGGQRDYAVECIAQKGKDCTLVANWTPSQGTLDGQWEQSWTKNLSSMFQFAVTSSNDRRLAMMLPNYSGKITWANSLHNVTLQKSQQGSIFFSTLHRLIPSVLMGTKLIHTPENGHTNLAVGGQYRMHGGKPGELEILEFRASLKQLTAMYTRQISKHSVLATKLDFQTGPKVANSALFYKYLFGSEQMGSQIMGSIDSKFTCKCIFMMPFLQRFMLRVHGEMNHFDFNPKLGQVPHKFGFNIMMQI